MTVAELRLEAAKAGVNETGMYCAWLENEVLHLRRHRDELITANNIELDLRRAAQRALAELRGFPA